MNAYITAAKQFASDEAGITAIEYGLIAAVMAAAVLASVALLKQPLIDTFTGIGTKLTAP
jgi:pilus assembly protein Flp/PilA